MSAFKNLSSSRAVGFGIGAIPVSEILAYCELFRIDGEDEREDMLYYVSELDMEYLGHVNKDAPKHGHSTKIR